MSLSLAKAAYGAFNKEKPHSSITEWVEILTSDKYDDEAYDGIPEIVDSINLQPTGPAEASRAIRKKIKHGNVHQQYRALVILKALVENGGTRFQSGFADSQLTDAIKHLGTDSGTDPKVKKKLLYVLASWHDQFKDDRSMALVAGLFRQVRPPPRERPKSVGAAPAAARPIGDPTDPMNMPGHLDTVYEEQRKRAQEAEIRRQMERDSKENAKRKARMDKEAERLKREEDARKARMRGKRKPFNFEQEKPQILAAIATASQASSNLVNAITLVNTESDKLTSNERVQECLEKAKLSRKQIVRYVQLVENEELIGTLIETNERIIAAMQMYDTLSDPKVTEKDVTKVQEEMARVNIKDSELGKLQEKQRAAVQRAMRSNSGNSATGRGKEAQAYEHPDLQDLSFGSIGGHSNLPPPIRPTRRTSSDEDDGDRHGTLSDFSDYDSSDEEAQRRASTSDRYGGASGSRNRSHSATHPRAYAYVSDEEGVATAQKAHEEDPFADPFAD